MGIRSAHAVVRLDHHRVAHLRHKGLAACKVIHHVVAGGGDTGLLIVLLHLALVLDAGHIRGLEAAGNVEIGAQGGIPFQPVFIVGLQPVDAAILEGEKRPRRGTPRRSFPDCSPCSTRSGLPSVRASTPRRAGRRCPARSGRCSSAPGRTASSSWGSWGR